MEGKLLKGREASLEVGLLILAMGIAGAIGFLVAGKGVSSVQGRVRRGEPHPERGSIKAERHQHISTVAAR